MSEPSPLPAATDPSTADDLSKDMPSETAQPVGNDPALPEPDTIIADDDAADLADLINAMRAAMDPNSELETDDPANWRGHHD